MKKILLTALLSFTFINVNASAIEVIETDTRTQITAYCIADYVFLEIGGGGVLTQLLDGDGEAMRCSRYEYEMNR